MGLSRKISRIGKTKKEKEAVKIIKSSTQQIQKQSQPKKRPSKALENIKQKTQKSSKNSKYVTEGMVDYVTLLRSRKSGPKLRTELKND